MKKSNQVLDNKQLLLRMMNEIRTADELYRPTNYWTFYEKILLPELLKKGLKDFRRRKNSILDCFGATDLLPHATLQYEGKYKIKGLRRVVEVLSRIFDRIGIISSLSYPPKELTNYFFRYVKNKFDQNSIDIFLCPSSEIGNPEDMVIIKDTCWSFTYLQYCAMVIDAFKHIKFSNDMIFCELGSGLGRNIEVLSQLYRNATFILFDIPPQLYVANQYLSSVFRERLVSYEEAVEINPEAQGGLPEHLKGKIIILPTWKMPNWAKAKIDIFWNSASFSEMEPEVVKNYLNLVKSMRPKSIYINALPKGNYWGEWEPGKGGTKAPVLDQYYYESLEKSYTLKTKYYTDYFMREDRYVSYIFDLTQNDN